MKKGTFVTKSWIEVALINFCIVALAGVTMRYKINFSLPEINQKYLMYGHSNFAFIGWVSLALMTLMIRYLIRHGLVTNYTKYRYILLTVVLAAYGMFITFSIQGYNNLSNSFSIIAILASYLFIFFYWKDLKGIEDPSFSQFWLKGGMVLWGLSSIGEIVIAYLMANNVLVRDYYIAAQYFFLHFQYNGWFLFICFGTFFAYMQRLGFTEIRVVSKRLFWVMMITVFPAFFLSILWLKLPAVFYWTANLSGLLQLVVLFYFISILRLVIKNKQIHFHRSTSWLWTMASIAFILKIILQLFSIVPALSQFAFGFRPIIIGYLHLSFVGIISLYLFGYVNEFIHRFQGRVSGVGAIIFVAGFICQEIILMFQGLEAMNVQPVKSANLLLFGCVILQASGLIWITGGIFRAKDYEFENSPGKG